MKWNKHSEIDNNAHAILSPSQYYWLNYDDDKMINFVKSIKAKEIGTELHNFAATAIKYGTKLAKSKQTLNMYVNDAIGYCMTPEQPLKYSSVCYGTADAIHFNEKKKYLRIHDLKTGSTPAHFEQLEIYAALFCLEYRHNPIDLTIELRIYQNDDVSVLIPEPEDIQAIMNEIINKSEIVQNAIEEG